jgi:hypothetical protein
MIGSRSVNSYSAFIALFSKKKHLMTEQAGGFCANVSNTKKWKEQTRYTFMIL